MEDYVNGTPRTGKTLRKGFIKDGGPAFPESCNGSIISGMSLRDYFAIHADNYDIALIMERDENAENTPIGRLATITREQARYIHADAMLKAREE